MEKELLHQVKRFWHSAELVYRNNDYTSATILYFKALFVLLDYIILQQSGKTPKDHTERFRQLEKDMPKYYRILDKYYPIYRDTYSLSIEKEKCNEVRNNVRKIAQEQKIQL
jgi:HEPN domain-containing protein